MGEPGRAHLKRPSLLVINQYYAPDLASTGRYAAGLCSGLAKSGWHVRVVCGMPSYSQKIRASAPEFELRNGVEVHRVGLFGVAGRGSIARRFLGYSIFMVRGALKARQLAMADRPDIVLTFHNPPFVGLIGRHLACVCDVPFLYSPLDILPEVVKGAGWPLPDFAFGAWERINQSVHDSAAKILVLDESMRDVLTQKGVDTEKIELMRLWALPDLSDELPSRRLREEFGVGEEELLLLYAGNMGYMHSLDGILDAASRLTDLPLTFLCVGEGPGKSMVQARLEEGDLTHVKLLGYQTESRFRSLVASADAAFVSVRKGSEELGMPSRALTFLSAGTPIIALTRPIGGLANLVSSTGAGWIVSDPTELPSLIRSLWEDLAAWSRAARRSRRAYSEHFGQERSVADLQRVLEGVILESQLESATPPPV